MHNLRFEKGKLSNGTYTDKNKNCIEKLYMYERIS